jgi:hypothetical protein
MIEISLTFAQYIEIAWRSHIYPAMGRINNVGILPVDGSIPHVPSLKVNATVER